MVSRIFKAKERNRFTEPGSTCHDSIIWAAVEPYLERLSGVIWGRRINRKKKYRKKKE